MASIEDDIENGEKENRASFRAIIGKVWYTLLYFLALGTTFALALGCWSPTTQKFALSSTTSSSIICYLVNATSFNETQFEHPDLPDVWYWGFSGTCQEYFDPYKETKCYHAFPPLFTIQDLVEKALTSSNQSDTSTTIATWNAALSARPSDPAYSVLADSDSQRAKSVSFFRGAAAAMIFSLLIGFHNSFSSLALFFLRIDEKFERKYRLTLFFIAIFDSLLFAGALVCFIAALINGPLALGGGGLGGVLYDESLQNGLLGEMGYIVALAAFIFRLISVPIIAIVVFCILGFELLLIVLIGYLMLKSTGKLVENRSIEPGYRYTVSY